jgi:glutamate/aspartate transport system permease protein
LVILWFFIGLPMLFKALNNGVPVPIGAFTSCLVAFALFEAAYFAEIIRAGIQSISVGQRSAAYALGMSYSQTMRLVILPQVFRKMLPLIMQQTIILFQDLTLVYAVGLMDFFNSTRAFGDNSGNLNEFLLFAATVYFIISFCASTGIKHLQKHLQHRRCQRAARRHFQNFARPPQIPRRPGNGVAQTIQPLAGFCAGGTPQIDGQGGRFRIRVSRHR